MTNSSDLARLMEVVERNDFVILDTETNGTQKDSPIVQISIINGNGSPLVDTLIKPAEPIPDEATKIHGITNEMVQNAPTIDKVWPDIIAAVARHDVIIYNVQYDLPILEAAERLDLTRPTKFITKPFSWAARSTTCAMLAYGEYTGIWNSKFNNYTWHKLSEACQREKIQVENAHNAYGDCLMTLELVRAMYREYAGWLDRRAAMSELLGQVGKEVFEMQSVHENERVQAYLKAAYSNLTSALDVLLTK